MMRLPIGTSNRPGIRPYNNDVMNRIILLAVLVLSVQSFAQAQGEVVDRQLSVQRQAILKSSDLAVLQAAAKNPHAIIRRAVVQALVRLGEPASATALQILKTDSDALTRRSALRMLLKTSLAQQAIAIGLKDGDEMVRQATVEHLAHHFAQHPAYSALLEEAQNDASARVSRIASSALWPFTTEVFSVREKPQYQDHQLKVVQKIELPLEGWKFQTDPHQNGHKKQWFEASYNDKSWQPIGIGKSWQSQGQQYEGVAWYRLAFDLPARPDATAADVVFEAVDQAAWVWVNGEFVGQHDVGPEGWNKQFASDATALLRWGAQNHIVVRVMKKEGNHAGIWKPVFIEALKK